MSNEKKTGFWPVFKEILRVFLFVFVIPFVTAALCMILWLVLSETTLRFDTEHLALLAILPLTVGAYFLFRKALRPYIFWVKAGIALAMLIAVTVMLLISRGNPQGTVFYYGGQWLLVPYLPLLLLVLAVNLLEVLCVIVGAEALGALMSALILKLKPGKKWVIGLGATCAVLAAVIGLSYANGPQFRYKGHDFDYMHGYSSTDFTDFTVYAEHSKLVTLSEPATLSIGNPDEMPVLDGAEACYPVYAALAKAVYQGIDKIEAEAWERDSFPNGHIVQFTNTVQAFYRLIDGEVDMFFGSNPSKDQMEYAEYAGVELELTPIGKEGFVFFVEADNPVSGLTSDQIRAIYHGDITNWAEVGGKDQEIVAFQRPQNSGSQTRMLSFMGDVTLKEPVGYEVVSAMLGVITEVAEYANEAGAMGYTFRYFLEGLNQEKGVKILAVDGVYPTPATIADGSYPLTGSLCLVTRKNDPNPNVQKMIDFILSKQGQEIVEKTGYGRVKN